MRTYDVTMADSTGHVETRLLRAASFGEVFRIANEFVSDRKFFIEAGHDVPPADAECVAIVLNDDEDDDYGICEACGEMAEGDGNLYENADGALVCQYCL